MKIEISKIIYREDLYPRFKLDQKLIEKYSDSVEYLPPIIINQNNILIDGLHRMKAYELAGLKEINYELRETESEKELKKLAYQFNSNHGLQLSNKEKRTFANEMIGEMSVKKLSEILAVSEECVDKWTKNKREELEEQRDRKILELYLRAENIPVKIASLFGIGETTVRDRLKKIGGSSKFTETVETFEPFIYNIWNLAKKSEEDSGYFGVFPRTFMENLIYYHTEIYDIIYDPFAGSGTTVDVCQKWLRRYYCSDIKVRPGREADIKEWKIQQGLPEDLPKPAIAFLDPPYWLQAKEKHSNSPNDLANVSLEKFYGVFLEFLGLLISRKIGRIAVVIAPTQYPNKNHNFEDHIFRIHEMLSDKYEIEMRYVLPYSSEQYNGTQVDVMRKEKKALNLIRDLVVWRLR